MPENFKKYNIDGVPKKKYIKKRRGSENPTSLKDDDKYGEPYILDEAEGAASVVTGGMGEKSFSKRRL